MSRASDQTALVILELRNNAERLLQLLSDGKWHEHSELLQVAGYRYGGRIFDLRKRGYVIEKQRLGTRRYFYRMAPKGDLFG